MSDPIITNARTTIKTFIDADNLDGLKLFISGLNQGQLSSVKNLIISPDCNPNSKRPKEDCLLYEPLKKGLDKVNWQILEFLFALFEKDARGRFKEGKMDGGTQTLDACIFKWYKISTDSEWRNCTHPDFYTGVRTYLRKKADTQFKEEKLLNSQNTIPNAIKGVSKELQQGNNLSEEYIKQLIINNSLSKEMVNEMISQTALSEEMIIQMVTHNHTAREQFLLLVKAEIRNEREDEKKRYLELNRLAKIWLWVKNNWLPLLALLIAGVSLWRDLSDYHFP